MRELWTEKYRPKTTADYVFRDATQRNQIEAWVKEQSIPNVILTGSPGVGKTTLAKVLINELGIDQYDILEINASRENSVDTIRDRITGFVQTMPFGAFKVVLLDEADFISQSGQAALRGVLEEYSNTARFILTANYPNRIIPALHSRCQGFHVDRVDLTEFTARAATVLVEEAVEFDLDTLDNYVRATYPDLRKCLNMLQMNSTSGKLISANASDNSSTVDWKLNAVELFKAGHVTKAREYMCSQTRPEEMEDVFRWLYDNLQLWSTEPELQDQAIVIIRNGLVNHSFVADPEINLSATLVELAQLGK